MGIIMLTCPKCNADGQTFIVLSFTCQPNIAVNLTSTFAAIGTLGEALVLLYFVLNLVSKHTFSGIINHKSDKMKFFVQYVAWLSTVWIVYRRILRCTVLRRRLWHVWSGTAQPAFLYTAPILLMCYDIIATSQWHILKRTVKDRCLLWSARLIMSHQKML